MWHTVRANQLFLNYGLIKNGTTLKNGTHIRQVKGHCPFPSKGSLKVFVIPRLLSQNWWQAFGMLSSRMKTRDVARLVHCDHSTVARLNQRVQATGTRNDRPRPGQPHVTTPAQDCHMLLIHLLSCFQTADSSTYTWHCKHMSFWDRACVDALGSHAVLMMAATSWQSAWITLSNRG